MISLSTGLVNAMMKASGLSFGDALAGGEIRCFNAVSKPVNADAAETGTLVLTITLGSATHTPGSLTNGLTFSDTAVNGMASKTSAEIWSGVVAAALELTYFRHYDKNVITGASSTAVRYDGSIGTSPLDVNGDPNEMVVPILLQTLGKTKTLDEYYATLPKFKV